MPLLNLILSVEPLLSAQSLRTKPIVYPSLQRIRRTTAIVKVRS